MRLLLILFLLYNNCSVFGALNIPIKSGSFYDSISINNVLESVDAKILYKASIHLYKKDFSGIILLKKVESDTSWRLIFLSEIGLNLLDMKWKNNCFEVISCQDFLNRKFLLNVLKNDFAMLLRDLNDFKMMAKNKDVDEGGRVFIFREHSSRFFYYFNNDNLLVKIKKKDSLLSGVDVLMSRENRFLPQVIEFKHHGIKLRIVLTELSIN